MPQSVYAVPLQIDHTLARQHHGTDDPDNLALACLNCNLHKGPNLAGIDPDTGRLVPLFHPRRDKWDEHFRWSGPLLAGLTPTGRATLGVLAINDPAIVRVREALIAEGHFPPPTA
jgi:hypothetical protein